MPRKEIRLTESSSHAFSEAAGGLIEAADPTGADRPPRQQNDRRRRSRNPPCVFLFWCATALMLIGSTPRSGQTFHRLPHWSP